MYFNENRENTNIDKEFKKKRSIDFNAFKTPLLILGGLILVIAIIMLIMYLIKNINIYTITLEGQPEMTIYKGSTYIEPGYKGYDKNKKEYTVEVSGVVDTTKIGIYTIEYKLEKVVKTRKVKVVTPPDVPTVIHLKGDKNITLKQGQTYTEPGYTAVDYIDGELTNKVTVINNLNTSKPGIYRIVYTVINSDDVTTSELRTVVVE